MDAYGKKIAGAGSRGSILLTVLICSMMLAGILLTALSATRSGSSISREDYNEAQALAAAEYGAALAISRLSAGLVKGVSDKGFDTIEADWVKGYDGADTLFTNADGKALDQRRISGVYGEHEFRVRVRSARLAFGDPTRGPTMPASWLSDDPELVNKDFAFGEDKDTTFSDIYEITSTARNLDAGKAGGFLSNAPVVKTVIGLAVKDSGRDMLDNVGETHLDAPENFLLQQGTSETWLSNLQTGKSGYAEVASVKISGEDHALTNYAAQVPANKGGHLVKYLGGNDFDLYGSRSAYWKYGNLTVHRQTDLENRKFANPYRPLTRDFFTYDYDSKIPGDKDKLVKKNHQMLPLVANLGEFLDMKQRANGGDAAFAKFKRFPAPTDPVTKEALTDPAAPVSHDEYLMGGKGNGLSGRTITVVKGPDNEDLILEDRHYQASKTGDNYVEETPEDEYYAVDPVDPDEIADEEEDEDEEDDGGDADDEDENDVGDDDDVTELLLNKAEDVRYLYLNRVAVNPNNTGYHAGTAWADYIKAPNSSADISILKNLVNASGSKVGQAKLDEWAARHDDKNMRLTLKAPYWSYPVTIKEWWRQFYPDQYTYGALTAGDNAGALYYRSFPQLYAEAVRPQAMFIMTRPYKKGSNRRYVLVREYVKRYDVTKTNIGKGYVATSDGTVKGRVLRRDIEAVLPTREGNTSYHWEGNYTWVLCKFNIRKLGRVCFHIKEGRFKGYHAAPRIFHWQEIFGYSVEKRTGSDDFDPGTAYSETENTRFKKAKAEYNKYPGEPALDVDRRMITRYVGEKKDSNRVAVGFDERWQYDVYKTGTGAKISTAATEASFKHEAGKTLPTNPLFKTTSYSATGGLPHKPLIDLPIAYGDQKSWEKAKEGWNKRWDDQLKAAKQKWQAAKANSSSTSPITLALSGYVIPDEISGTPFVENDYPKVAVPEKLRIPELKPGWKETKPESGERPLTPNGLENVDGYAFRQLDDDSSSYHPNQNIIWVREPTYIHPKTGKVTEAHGNSPLAKLVPHRKLTDFTYAHAFTDGTQWYSHAVICLTVAIECRTEDEVQGPSGPYASEYAKRLYRYNGMIFNIYIAPNLKSELNLKTANSVVQEWWERNDSDGLSGRQAVPAISTNATPKPKEAVNFTLANFEKLGSYQNGRLNQGDAENYEPSLAESMYTPVDKRMDYVAEHTVQDEEGNWVIDDRELLPHFSPGFFRAAFEGEYANILTSECIERAVKDKAFQEMQPGRPAVFYYTDSDLFDVIQSKPEEMEDYINSDDEYDFEKALDLITGNEEKGIPNPNPETITLENGARAEVRFEHISKRWELEDVARGTMLKPEIVTSGNAADLAAGQLRQTSYRAIESDLYARRLAGQIIGFATQQAPTVKTSGFVPENGPNSASEPEPVNRSLGFLAGEIRLRGDGAGLVPDDGAQALPVRTLNGRFEDGSQAVVRDFTAPTPEEAVALCYRDYYPAGSPEALAIRENYGLKDIRRSIGFHRFGKKTDELAAKHPYGWDHLEVVSLGVAGYNPYRTDASGNYIAYERSKIEPGFDSEHVKVTYSTVFKNESDANGRNLAPTFVFDKPIDGAGALVVNGNLLIRSRFAYSGTLVVLGDLIVDPVLRRNQLIYGADGNPVDAQGNSLVEENGYWWYTWRNIADATDVKRSRVYLDYTGLPMIDPDGNHIDVAPLYKDVYDAELILQGNLILKGRLINNAVLDERVAETPNVAAPVSVEPLAQDDAGEGGEGEGEPLPPKTVVGRVNLFWGIEPIEMAADLWAAKKYEVSRKVWNIRSTLPADTLWQDKLDE
jgi:hypothetical protein